MESQGRFLFIRQENPVQRREPIQLDLFRPAESQREYKVIITNKSAAARNVARFHEGRGQQENVFGELKSESALSYIPFRRWNANKVYLLAAIDTDKVDALVSQRLASVSEADKRSIAKNLRLRTKPKSALTNVS